MPTERDSIARLMKKLLIALFAVSGLAFLYQFDGKTTWSYGLAWFGILLLTWAVVLGIHWCRPDSEKVDEIIRKS